MDSLLQTLYYAYVFIGGFCSVENVQYQNTKHFVYINTEEYQVRLIKSHKINDTTYACLDEEGSAWLFTYERSKKGYKIIFLTDEDAEELEFFTITISNLDICEQRE
jgi:hypothetical protein